MSIKNKISKLKPFIRKKRFYNTNNEIGSSVFSEYFCMLWSFFHEMFIFFQAFALGKSREPKNMNQWIERHEILKITIDPTITWIGHATFLIQINGINIITDPIFGNATILYPRIFPPGIKLNELPKIDYVLLSHNHRDHMDENSLIELKKFFPEIKFLVPMGDKKWFDKRRMNNTKEFMWWEKYEEKVNNSEIKFTFLPAYHWSQRTAFDHNTSLWGSWMIENNNKTIYFAGDTAYSSHFVQIAKEFKNIDIALMPIGPCEPRERMCHSHISAEESGKAFLELNAKYFIPMHWGTFHFGIDSFDTPLNRIKDWWDLHTNQLQSKKLILFKIGQQIQFKDLITELQDVKQQQIQN